MSSWQRKADSLICFLMMSWCYYCKLDKTLIILYLISENDNKDSENDNKD